MFWYKIAETKEELFKEGEKKLIEIEIQGKRICLAEYKDQLFGCAATCPHAGAKMAEGYVDALGNIVCPLHRYKFSLERGRNVTGEGYFLKTYHVEVRKEGVFVGIAEKKENL